jgi:uroporphyrinogen decarboxylase
MNSRERILAAISGKPHDRVPVAQHNFTFCMRYYGITLGAARKDPELAANALAATAFDLGYDGIIIDFDTCTLAEAMGSKLVYPEDEPARVFEYALKRLEQVEQLAVPDPTTDGRMPLWLETTRQVRRLVGDEKAIMARADQGPFGLLFQLRDPQEFMIELLEGDESLLHKGLEICTQAGVAFAKAQLAAGADLTSIGDSAAGQSLISPEMYYRLAFPYQKLYKEQLGDGLLSLHICGKTNDIIKGMIDTGSDVLEIDHYNNLEKTLEIAADRTSVWGNLDPSATICFGSRDTVFEQSRLAIETGKRLSKRFVLCPGCLVNSNTPTENVRAMTEAALEFGHYG